MGRKHPARAPVADALPCARECRLAAISVGDAHATTYKQIV
jgi:hypothetical protein